ncbi:hypothetical protein HDF18_01890 [Mucilaginibacter sp. X5P1]|uniref:hypothetical protein n=1 Tax=Mucilaginibacter sp. X5P1 TaxID=2723088 RepID=UPI00161859F9|nr:hypothetical protein [Mucilaginibacter sp. X5P1]MBB6138139.1 hypothetical protein [Mucilaginibacter sp. X5P1]
MTIEIKSYSNFIKNDPNDGAEEILKKLMYIKLTTKDIVLTLRIIDKEKNHDEKNVLLRLLSLLLYEFYGDIGNLYDKKFEKKIMNLLSSELAEMLKSIKKMTAIIGGVYFDKLKEIRMNIIGHKDFDTVKQLEIMNRVDAEEIKQMARSALFIIYFFDAFHTSFTVKILKKMNLKVPNDVPMFKHLKDDFKLWDVYSKYIQDKKNTSTKASV